MGTKYFNHKEDYMENKPNQVTLNENILISQWTLLAVLRNRLNGLVGRVFANGQRDLGSIPGRVIPKTFKMVLDTSLFNTQQYKVRIEGEVDQSRERSKILPNTSV